MCSQCAWICFYLVVKKILKSSPAQFEWHSSHVLHPMFTMPSWNLHKGMSLLVVRQYSTPFVIILKLQNAQQLFSMQTPFSIVKQRHFIYSGVKINYFPSKVWRTKQNQVGIYIKQSPIIRMQSLSNKLNHYYPRCWFEWIYGLAWIVQETHRFQNLLCTVFQCTHPGHSFC